MTPPEAPDIKTGIMPPAASSRLVQMRTRPQFLAAARAQRQGTGSLLVQARDRRDGCDETRVGFTCSKKVGNAVARNRAKRRLREIARDVLGTHGRPGWDYVLIGRPGATGSVPFDQLRRDLAYALKRLHRDR